MCASTTSLDRTVPGRMDNFKKKSTNRPNLEYTVSTELLAGNVGKNCLVYKGRLHFAPATTTILSQGWTFCSSFRAPGRIRRKNLCFVNGTKSVQSASRLAADVRIDIDLLAREDPPGFVRRAAKTPSRVRWWMVTVSVVQTNLGINLGLRCCSHWQCVSLRMIVTTRGRLRTACRSASRKEKRMWSKRKEKSKDKQIVIFRGWLEYVLQTVGSGVACIIFGERECDYQTDG